MHININLCLKQYLFITSIPNVIIECVAKDAPSRYEPQKLAHDQIIKATPYTMQRLKKSPIFYIHIIIIVVSIILTMQCVHTAHVERDKITISLQHHLRLQWIPTLQNAFFCSLIVFE